MPIYRVSCWTGPCWVDQFAAHMRAAGLTVVCEGTERVLLDVEALDSGGAAWNTLAMLYKAHKTDFGLRPRVLFQVTQENA